MRDMGNIDEKTILRKKFDSPELQKVQDEIIKITTTRTDELLEKYKELVSSRDGSYINSDLMKMIFDIYARSQENRGKYNLAITNSAACLTNEFYMRAIKNKNINRCIYVAGPYGAGKLFFIQSLYEAHAIPKDTIVYEGSITAPAFGKKVEQAIRNNIKPELVILNPTLELSLRNIKQREIETGRGVIKSEVVEKYADLYPNVEKLFEHLRLSFPELGTYGHPISLQIYNKTKNVEENLDNTSYDINDLRHGTREEVSKEYDLTIRQLSGNSLDDDDDDREV